MRIQGMINPGNKNGRECIFVLGREGFTRPQSVTCRGTALRKKKIYCSSRVPEFQECVSCRLAACRLSAPSQRQVRLIITANQFITEQDFSQASEGEIKFLHGHASGCNLTEGNAQPLAAIFPCTSRQLRCCRCRSAMPAVPLPDATRAHFPHYILEMVRVQICRIATMLKATDKPLDTFCMAAGSRLTCQQNP